MDTRATLKKLNHEMHQKLMTKETSPDLLEKISLVYTQTGDEIGEKLFGNLWGACSEAGTGLDQQLTYAKYFQIGKQVNCKSDDKKTKATDPHAIVYANFFGNPSIDISDPSYVQQVITFNHDAVPGQDTTEIFSSIFGPDNIFDSPTFSKTWTHLNTAFHHYLFAVPRLNKLMPTMHEIVEEYLLEIAENQGSIENIKDFSARVTMDMIAKTQLGILDFPIEIKRFFTEVVDEAIKKIANPKMAFPHIAKKVIEQFDKHVRHQKTLDEILSPGFEKLAELMQQNIDSILTGKNWIRDVSIKTQWMQKYAKNTKESKHADEEAWEKALETRGNDITDIFHSDSVIKDAALFIVVGHETSANFTAFLLMCLGKHAWVIDHIRQETAEYLENTRKTLEELTVKDMHNLFYLKAVCYEVLRMFPPVPRLKGVVNRDVILAEIPFIQESNAEKAYADYALKMQERDCNRDVVLKKGGYFFISTLNLQLNEAVYPHPLVFDPERFLSKGQDGERCFKEPDAHKWFPFGFGRRECPGKYFAIFEAMRLALGIVQRYNLRVDDPHCFQTNAVFSLHPKNIVSMQASEVLSLTHIKLNPLC